MLLLSVLISYPDNILTYLLSPPKRKIQLIEKGNIPLFQFPLTEYSKLFNTKLSYLTASDVFSY